MVIWAQRFEETGSVAAKPSGGSTSPLEEHAEFLLALIAAQPDLTLDEVRDRLQAGRQWELSSLPPFQLLLYKSVFDSGFVFRCFRLVIGDWLEAPKNNQLTRLIISRVPARGKTLTFWFREVATNVSELFRSFKKTPFPCPALFIWYR